MTLLTVLKLLPGSPKEDTSFEICMSASPDILYIPQVKYGVRSPNFIWAPCAQMYSLAETPQPSPLPPHLGSYTRAQLVSNDRRHLFVTPWYILIKSRKV
jgi:hypothetical protein